MNCTLCKSWCVLCICVPRICAISRLCCATWDCVPIKARWHVNGIDELRHFASLPFWPIELSMWSAWSTWYASIYLVAWINNFTAARYPVDAQQLLRIARHETSRKLSVAYQYTRFQIAICRLWKPYQDCLPSCELHMHSRSLTVGCTGKVESS